MSDKASRVPERASGEAPEIEGIRGTGQPEFLGKRERSLGVANPRLRPPAQRFTG